MHKPPELPAHMPWLERAATVGGHLILYFLLFAFAADWIYPCRRTPAYVVYRNLNRRISSRATSLKSLSGSIADPPLARSRSSRTERFGEK
jgi:cytochrome b561